MTYPALYALMNSCQGNVSFQIQRTHFLEPSPHAERIVFDQQTMCRKNPISEKAHTLAYPVHPAFFRMDLQTQGGKKTRHGLLDPPQSLLLVAESDKIIHVADIRQPEGLLDKMIKAVQIDIGKKLTRKIADGNSSFSPQGCEEVISLKVEWPVRIVSRTDDLLDKP